MLLNKLPIDIIRKILSYLDSIKLRNGKYMNQIPHTDIRYEILRKLKQNRCSLFITPNYHNYFLNYISFSNGSSMQIRYSEDYSKILFSYVSTAHIRNENNKCEF
jgi:hypothetical protein